MLQLHEQLANIPVVAQETARMAQAFRSWPASHWSRAAYCPGWTAADVVAHLATGGDFYAEVITSGRSGKPALPWGASNPAEFRARRQAAAQTLLEGGPAALLDGFEHAGARLQAVLESLQESELSMIALHPRGPIPLVSWIGMRLLELSAHDWDIRQPHDAEAHLSPTAAAALLRSLPELQCRLLASRLTEGLDGVYVLKAGGVTWGFVIQGKSVTVLEQTAPPAQCDVSLSTDAESMLLLTVGRAETDAKLQNAALTITGNTDQGQQFCATLFRSY